MVKAAVPELLKATLCAALLLCDVWLPKLIDEELRTACGVPCPTPLTATVCGDPAALVVMTMLAARLPTATGVNTTEIAQLAPVARAAAAGVCLSKVRRVSACNRNTADGQSSGSRIAQSHALCGAAALQRLASKADRRRT